VIVCLRDESEAWGKFSTTLGEPGLASDARFTNSAQRTANAAALAARLDAIVAKRSSLEWITTWRERGIPCSEVRNLAELAEDPQAWANDYFLTTHCAEVDREVEIRGLPITLSKTPGRVESLGPELGQDTEIILMEALGMEWERIEQLKSEGVIP